MDPATIASLLVDRLTKIVPDGFYVAFDGKMIWYTAEEGRFPGQQNTYEVGKSGDHFIANLTLPDDAFEDRVTEAARLALGHLQDYVAEATHDPWPGTKRMPRAEAETRNSKLYLWFGDHGELVLECEPIPLI